MKIVTGTGNKYVEIASKINGEHETNIGLHVDFGNHPHTGAGHFIVRFIAYGLDGAATKFKHFTSREEATFTAGESIYPGFRLNRIAIPAITPGVPKGMVRQLADDNQLFILLGVWINSQVDAEGFTPLFPDPIEAAEMLQSFFPAGDKPVVALELPDLTKK